MMSFFESFHFPFETDELKLLLLLHEETSVKRVSEKLGRDTTTVTRQLHSISKKHPVLEKNDGMWKLTALGSQVAQHCRRMFLEQHELLGNTKVIRIGTTKEFSEWILTPALSRLLAHQSSGFRIQILTEIGSAEQALMEGRIDLALSCGNPVDPTIKFKRVKKFPLVCVYRKKLKEGNTVETLSKIPAVEHTELTIRSLLPQLQNLQITAQFDHIAGVRSAARSGLGWCILPQYSVQKDLDSRGLFEVDLPPIKDLNEEFSIWYMRNHSNLEKVVKQLIQALTEV